MRRNLLICLLLTALATGCAYFKAPDGFTPKQKAEYTTLQTLKAAKEFRVFGLESAGTMYKLGLLDDKTKGEIIETGDNLQAAINTAADALIWYHRTGDVKDKQSVEDKLAAYQELFNDFMEIVTPHLIGGENG
jgi:hypothetical protein